MTAKVTQKNRKKWYQTSFLNALDESLSMPQSSQHITPKAINIEPESSKLQSKPCETIGLNTSEPIKRNEQGRRIGESHPRSKYTDREIELVLQLKDIGMTVRKIAAKMDMPFSTVGAICSGRSRNQFPSKVTRK